MVGCGSEEFCLTAELFRLRRVTWKSTPSNQGCLLPVGPFLRQGSFTSVSLRGPAPNGHPCPDGALAASMRLDPLRVVCVRPAPKSRWVSAELPAYEDQNRITSGSKASRLKPVPLGNRAHPGRLALAGPTNEPRTPVGLVKAGPTNEPRAPVGLALAGKLLCAPTF